MKPRSKSGQATGETETNKVPHPYRSTIPPLLSKDEERRPFWSVMIPTYNCAVYLRETLQSVLAQDLGPDLMQIEVVDDCSTEDDPAAVVAELARGRVAFYRQPHNVGHVANFNTCLQRARGQLVHLLHGDDCVREGFYRTMQQPFRNHPEIGAAFCRYISMDEQGHWQTISQLEQHESGPLDHWLEKIAVGQRLQTPSVVVRREVYEHVGGFDSRLAWTEDWEMWVRIAAHYPVWHETEPLALYRVHSSSSTGRLMRTGENIQDVRRAIEINKSYLRPERASELSNVAREQCALAAIRRARRAIDAGNLQTAMPQLREALKTYRSPIVVTRALFVLALWLKRSGYSSMRNRFYRETRDNDSRSDRRKGQ